MSKHKYAKDVSGILYAREYKDFGFGTNLEWEREDDDKGEAVAPVRIVRESFYRELIKAYKEKNK